MAIQSFYISLEICESEKQHIVTQIGKDFFEKYKKTKDLLYKKSLYIDDINNEEGEWWHINVGYYNLFYNVEVLFELLDAIDVVKPKFSFFLLGKKYEFLFSDTMDLFQFIYPKIQEYKENFEANYGVLSVHPQQYFCFRRRTQKYWTKK